MNVNGTSYSSRNEDSKSSSVSTSVITTKQETLSRDRRNLLYEPHVLTRYICRLALVMITALLAISIPCFGLLINLLGSGTVSVLTYVLPPLLHSVLVTSKSWTPTVPGHNDGNDKHIAEFSKNDYFLPSQQLWIDRFLFLLGSSFAVVATSVTFVSVYDQLASPTSQC